MGTLQTMQRNAMKWERCDTVYTLRHFFDGLQRTRENNPYGWQLGSYPIILYEKGITMMNDDWTAGFSVTPDKELISVWSYGGGQLKAICDAAIALGATHLSCYGYTLSNKYYDCGFRLNKLANFDRKLAPADWTPDKGYPKYIEMVKG